MSTTISRRTALTGAAALAAGTASAPFRPAAAQSAVTTLVVPFPPGGSTDALARLLQAGLEKRLGRTVIIENKPGAAGSLGAAAVAKAPADGSSILVTFDSHAVIPAILEKPSLDVEKDLLPVMLVGTAPYLIAAGVEKPYKSIADVVAAAKAKAGSVTYGSVGIGTIGHLAMTLLGKRAGAEITHVAYRGGGPAMNDLIGGHVDLVCGSAALITPHVAGGKVRVISQLGTKRLERLKDVPTAMESGFENFTAEAWWGVFAPKGTPAATIAAVEKAFRDTISEPEVTKRLRETQEMNVVLGGPEALDAFFKKEVAAWGKVVRDNAIKAQ